MSYKRIEMYVGWTCNQKCTYCMEFPNMDKNWDKKVTKYEFLKQLIKYKKDGCNHVTLLGGEPFIQPVFYDALKISKKMKFATLVTTNATTLHLEKEAEKYLPLIDELILSVEAIDKDLQQKISRTNVFVRWEEVFNNINKYWKGSYFKANIVLTIDNLYELYNLVKYVHSRGVKDIAITYPDLEGDYYGKDHLKKCVAPTYTESIKEVERVNNFCNENNINLKIVDFPFCVFSKDKIEEFVSKTDEIDYSDRIKVVDSVKENGIIYEGEIKRSDVIPRKRRLIKNCEKCKYIDLCWGPSVSYELLYGFDEIKPII